MGFADEGSIDVHDMQRGGWGVQFLLELAAVLRDLSKDAQYMIERPADRAAYEAIARGEDPAKAWVAAQIDPRR